MSCLAASALILALEISAGLSTAVPDVVATDVCQQVDARSLEGLTAIVRTADLRRTPWGETDIGLPDWGFWDVEIDWRNLPLKRSLSVACRVSPIMDRRGPFQIYLGELTNGARCWLSLPTGVPIA